MDSLWLRRLRGGLAGLLVVVLVATAVHVEPAVAQAADVRINEFLASNTSGLVDNTGEFEDWIELYNAGSTAVDLGGWTLAADGDVLVFPAGYTIASGAYQVVFASGEPSRNVGFLLHAPFKLSTSGEVLELRNAAGTLVGPSWPAPGYPVQLPDESYGVAADGSFRYFASPSPAAVNDAGLGGRVEAVTFSVPHGWYSSTQQVVLNTTTSGASIRYTIDGSTPSATNGTLLSPGSSVTVASTTALRAIGFRSGWSSSAVETRSYLFAADIAQQSTSTPAGWPANQAINNQQMYYGMDPGDVPGGAATVESALTSIPSLVLTTDLENWVDPTDGIYVNPGQRGDEWERPVAIELIDPTGAEVGFDHNGGVRIRGGSSRSVSNPKHSFQLVFSGEYGDGPLEYPLFGSEGVSEFERMNLRTSQLHSWAWRRWPQWAEAASYIEDVWSRDTQGAMGQPYTRTRAYHLFLNGQYWGLFQTQERATGSYGASYRGGDEDDYDVLRMDRAVPPGLTVSDYRTGARDGDLVAWQTLWPLVNDLSVTDAEFVTLDDQVDLVNLADYYLLHFFAGHIDGAPSWWIRDGTTSFVRSNNWYGLRDRTGVGPGGKWFFLNHDSEATLCLVASATVPLPVDTTPITWNLDGSAFDDVKWFSPPWLHEALITHPAYRQIFVDRVQLHMLDPGGALSVAAGQARLDMRADEIRVAIDAESARWGDTGGVLHGRPSWEGAVADQRQCIAERYDVLQGQLERDGLWPVQASPAITPAGGAVPFGTDVTVTASTGAGDVLWVTTDGSDPRALDGSVGAAASAYTGPLSLDDATVVNARVQTSAGLWSPLATQTYTLSSTGGPARMVLNEYNAVSSTRYLGGGAAGDLNLGTDDALGRVLGNGGDWIELVVVENNLDIRGWTVEVWDANDGIVKQSAALVLGNNAVLSNLNAGTLITISEDIADNASYNPVAGDWHINLQSNDVLAGNYITDASQSNFAVNSKDTQVAIRDASGGLVALRTGEGTVSGVSVSALEVFKLEVAPTDQSAHDDPGYNDGTSSTWGLPNRFAAGAQVQDLSGLRLLFGDVDCTNSVNLLDARNIAQFAIGLRTPVASCPLGNAATQTFTPAGDVDGTGTVSLLDARLVAQCSIGVSNAVCP